MAGKSTFLQVRIDPDVKEQAGLLFSQFGITISDAVNIFLHQSIIERGLPFRMSIDPVNMTQITMQNKIERLQINTKDNDCNY